jgi:hypothetical protein
MAQWVGLKMAEQILNACCRHRWEFVTPGWAIEGSPDVLVPTAACRSVVFIGNVDPEGAFVPRATGFLVHAARFLPGAMFFPYLVTAEHVVNAMHQKGMELHCRINLKDGKTAVIPLTGKWWFHPPSDNPSDLQTDVAVMPFGLRPDLVDHEYISLTDTAPHVDRIARLGEEVFLMGLFKSHYGQRRNIPIVRIGNIAALPAEPVETSYCGPVDAYLVEVRSIAGLSGSPVFKNAEGKMPWPKREPLPVSAADRANREQRRREEIDWFDWHFVGLVHGHFDVKNFTEDHAVDDAATMRNEVNTGIAIVIPAQKVIETIFQFELQREQWEIATNAQKQHAATADVAVADESGAPASATKADEANPDHREDFKSLLSAAAKPKPSGGQT